MKTAQFARQQPMIEGQLVTARDGRRYRVARVAHTSKERGITETLQLERETPKIRGKAARRADKRVRRMARS